MPTQLPMQIEKLSVNLKKEYPHWGAPKIRERLRRVYPDVHCPVISTVHAVPGSKRLGEAPEEAQIQSSGNSAVASDNAQRVVVC